MTFKLVCFDLDGTLVENTDSIWVTIHQHLNIDDSFVREGLRLYKNGEIGWEEWAARDLAAWQRSGAKKEDIDKAIAGLRLFPGAREALHALKAAGLKTAIVSGSLSIVLQRLLPDYKELFDYVYISEMLFHADGTLADITHPLHIGGEKERALLMICEKLDVTPEETVFVGDHYNDVAAMKRAGLGIAFCTDKEDVLAAADVAVGQKDVRAILPIILKA